MADSVEEQLKSFYDQKGWSESPDGQTLDAVLWEDLRPAAKSYVSKCRLRLLPYLHIGGEKILDAASGPIQYPEYLEYSKNFKKRVCVDISQVALDNAQKKLGDRGDYFCCSLLDLPFEESSFDAVLSLHTIYHINVDHQQKAVSELIRVAKPGAPILIVYSNSLPLSVRWKRLNWLPFRLWRKFFEKKAAASSEVASNLNASSELASSPSAPVYFYPQPYEWWEGFRTSNVSLEIRSWRFLTAEQSRALIPDNFFGKLFFIVLAFWERSFPQTAARWCAYPVMILRKRV